MLMLYIYCSYYVHFHKRKLLVVIGEGEAGSWAASPPGPRCGVMTLDDRTSGEGHSECDILGGKGPDTWPLIWVINHIVFVTAFLYYYGNYSIQRLFRKRLSSAHSPTSRTMAWFMSRLGAGVCSNLLRWRLHRLNSICCSCLDAITGMKEIHGSSPWGSGNCMLVFRPLVIFCNFFS